MNSDATLMEVSQYRVPPTHECCKIPLYKLTTNFKKRGLICLDGIGKHPINNWPGEIIVLALGLDLEAAKSLARHCEQHAFVWAAGDGAV